ncbi:MAG: 5-formyltetrahydrofolate cyclo-ligase [Bacteroidaceae bacterium]|nr:5-formyltetrahydrofolate cyclo-ligase [Bacteroidaceae bacterium]
MSRSKQDGCPPAECTDGGIVVKSDLRNRVRQLKRQCSADILAEHSARISSRLMMESPIKNAGTVLAYYPLPDEVSIIPLIEWLVGNGKRVLLPQVVSGTDMVLREYKSPSDLKAGAYGIMEPQGRVFADYHLIDVGIIPGMAFDRHGHRLGRGKGYYDRFISKAFPTEECRPHLIGVAFPFQIMDTIPTDSNDVPVDEVVF